MPGPQSLDEFLDLLDQAIFETDELLESVEFDETGEYEPFVPVYHKLGAELRALQSRLHSGDHDFANGADLGYMAILKEYRSVIPFAYLLEVLNHAHHSGFSSGSSASNSSAG